MNQINLADFHGTPVSIIDNAGKKWLTSETTGLCLGYNESNARQGVNNLFKRHEDEFTDSDTCVINLMTQGQMRETRVFSDTGCIKLGFFANTPRAKEFRAWASQVLAGQAAHATTRPSAAQTGRPIIGTRRIERLVFELFVAGMNQTRIGKELHISLSMVNLMLNAKYRFSAAAGSPECSAELIAAVAQRHLEIEQIRLIEMQERIAQKYLANSHNQELADALDRVGRHLQQAPMIAALPPMVDGGAQ